MSTWEDQVAEVRLDPVRDDGIQAGGPQSDRLSLQAHSCP